MEEDNFFVKIKTVEGVTGWVVKQNLERYQNK